MKKQREYIHDGRRFELTPEGKRLARLARTTGIHRFDVAEVCDSRVPKWKYMRWLGRHLAAAVDCVAEWNYEYCMFFHTRHRRFEDGMEMVCRLRPRGRRRAA